MKKQEDKKIISSKISEKIFEKIPKKNPISKQKKKTKQETKKTGEIDGVDEKLNAQFSETSNENDFISKEPLKLEDLFLSSIPKQIQNLEKNLDKVALTQPKEEKKNKFYSDSGNAYDNFAYKTDSYQNDYYPSNDKSQQKENVENSLIKYKSRNEEKNLRPWEVSNQNEKVKDSYKDKIFHAHN
ncbi:MAG: hypothetical protein ACOYT4_05520 [Nanoarchaeota archaeon]